VLECLKKRRKWTLPAVMTALARLCDKGFVHCDRTTRTNYYSALISEKDYKASEGSSFLEKLYGNSLQNLVTSLYDSKAIDGKDLSELRKMIDGINAHNTPKNAQNHVKSGAAVSGVSSKKARNHAKSGDENRD
jgi:predicted transcriptional regulator